MSVVAAVLMLLFLLVMAYLFGTDAPQDWDNWGMKAHDLTWWEFLCGLLFWACAGTFVVLLVIPGGTGIAGNALSFLGQSLGAFFRWLVAHV